MSRANCRPPNILLQAAQFKLRVTGFGN